MILYDVKLRTLIGTRLLCSCKSSQTNFGKTRCIEQWAKPYGISLAFTPSCLLAKDLLSDKFVDLMRKEHERYHEIRNLREKRKEGIKSLPAKKGRGGNIRYSPARISEAVSEFTGSLGSSISYHILISSYNMMWYDLAMSVIACVCICNIDVWWRTWFTWCCSDGLRVLPAVPGMLKSLLDILMPQAVSQSVLLSCPYILCVRWIVQHSTATCGEKETMQTVL